jgi:hypothetical protein
VIIIYYTTEMFILLNLVLHMSSTALLGLYLLSYVLLRKCVNHGTKLNLLAFCQAFCQDLNFAYNAVFFCLIALWPQDYFSCSLRSLREAKLILYIKGELKPAINTIKGSEGPIITDQADHMIRV